MSSSVGVSGGVGGDVVDGGEGSGWMTYDGDTL